MFSSHDKKVHRCLLDGPEGHIPRPLRPQGRICLSAGFGVDPGHGGRVARRWGEVPILAGTVPGFCGEIQAPLGAMARRLSSHFEKFVLLTEVIISKNQNFVKNLSDNTNILTANLGLLIDFSDSRSLDNRRLRNLNLHFA